MAEGGSIVPMPFMRLHHEYPKGKTHRNKEAWVKYDVVVDQTGRVQSVEVIDKGPSRFASPANSGKVDDGFIEAGREAIMQYRYFPAVRDGEVVQSNYEATLIWSIVD